MKASLSTSFPCLIAALVLGTSLKGFNITKSCIVPEYLTAVL